jgi:DNA-binding response OmpR family regulator
MDRTPPPPGRPKLLLVDDDRDLVELLTFALGRAGIAVLPAGDPPTALALLEAERPDIAILDVPLGPASGLDLLRDLRRRSGIPVILLSALHAEDDRVRGLEAGADDYLPKPFSYRELLARIRAQLRRARQAAGPAPAAPAASAELPEAPIKVGPLVLNAAEHDATHAGRPLHLTATEFRVLQYLVQHAGSVAPTRALMRHVWGYDDPSGSDMVRVTVHRLRRKLEADPAAARLLHTVPGVGVLLKPEAGGPSEPEAGGPSEPQPPWAKPRRPRAS